MSYQIEKTEHSHSNMNKTQPGEEIKKYKLQCNITVYKL